MYPVFYDNTLIGQNMVGDFTSSASASSGMTSLKLGSLTWACAMKGGPFHHMLLPKKFGGRQIP